MVAKIGEIVGGFLLAMDGNGQLRLQDTDGFNNWGSVPLPECSVAEAAAYAVECDLFKRGLRSTLTGPAARGGLV